MYFQPFDFIQNLIILKKVSSMRNAFIKIEVTGLIKNTN